jgi:hypothetical protein
VLEELLAVFNCSVLTFGVQLSSIVNRTPEYVTIFCTGDEVTRNSLTVQHIHIKTHYE